MFYFLPIFKKHIILSLIKQKDIEQITAEILAYKGHDFGLHGLQIQIKFTYDQLTLRESNTYFYNFTCSWFYIYIYLKYKIFL